MKRITQILLFCCLLSGAFPGWAQRQTDNWFFGVQASLEFSGNTPASFFISAMDAPEGCASISDENGNLLFYTNGQTVWNRLHQVMVNGTGLLGNHASTQSSLIIPSPGNDSIYYLFTTDMNTPAGVSANGLRYSIININANNGMGEVLLNSKNVLLTGNAPNSISEKLAGVHHFNNQDVWVMTQRNSGPGSQEFITYKVTAAGVNTTPVISSVSALPVQTGRGYLKISSLGNKIAACFANHGFQLLDFDTKTGIVSNPQTLLYQPRSYEAYYGAEFSPDGTKLYVSEGLAATTSRIMQYNLAAGNLQAIINSKAFISNTIISGVANKALQLARNGKIYVTHANSNIFSEIASPNNVGLAANFKTATVQPNNTLASGSIHGFGFPNFIQSYFAAPRFSFTGICAESPTVFTIPNTTGIDSVRWNFDDPGTISPNISTQLQPSHTYFTPGTYNVTLIIYTQGMQSVFERQVTILNRPLVNLGKDTTICEGQKLNLASNFPHSPFNERFLWSTGDTVPAIQITAPGIYWLQLNNGKCTARDTIRITTRKPPEVDLGEDIFTCGNISVTLDAGNPGATYLWQPNGETTRTISVNSTGLYQVTVTVNGCSASDAKSVTILSMAGLELGPDISACEEEPVIINPNISTGTGTTFFWSDSSSGPELQVTKSGKYWLQLSRNGCEYTDTVNVTLYPCPPPPIPVTPNIITPNGDNLNDKFVITNIPEGVWNLKIYNRWGMLMFEKKGYRNEFPRDKISDGNYYYLLEDPDTGRLFKGWLEVEQ